MAKILNMVLSVESVIIYKIIFQVKNLKDFHNPCENSHFLKQKHDEEGARTLNRLRGMYVKNRFTDNGNGTL